MDVVWLLVTFWGTREINFDTAFQTQAACEHRIAVYSDPAYYKTPAAGFKPPSPYTGFQCVKVQAYDVPPLPYVWILVTSWGSKQPTVDEAFEDQAACEHMIAFASDPAYKTPAARAKPPYTGFECLKVPVKND